MFTVAMKGGLVDVWLQHTVISSLGRRRWRRRRLPEKRRKKRNELKNHKFVEFFKLNLFILFIKSNPFIYFKIKSNGNKRVD